MDVALQENEKTSNYQTLADIAKDYYDSTDANNFYFKIWGGEHIHIGTYEDGERDIHNASLKTLDAMFACAPIDADTRAIDLGAGYGGTARYLAKKFGAHVTCLNISTTQNAINARFNAQQGFDSHITIEQGDFADLPAEDESYTLAYSLDAFVHSPDREKVVQEAYRVLKPGGSFMFTDLMKAEACPYSDLQQVLERIKLSSMGSFETYTQYAENSGFTVQAITDQTPHMITHYQRVREETLTHYDAMVQACGQDYIDAMCKGLEIWVNAGKAGNITWGRFHFVKPE